MDKMEGKAKEAYGAIIGDEELKAEGQRDKQELKDKCGLLGNVSDTLPKL